METDGVLIPRIWQPYHMLSWTRAAMEFLYTKNDFVRVERKMTAGRWSPTCFLIKGLVDKPFKDFTEANIKYVRDIIAEFRQIEFVHNMEEAFKDNLEYPPFHLDDNWDGKCGLRRNWARYVYDNEPRLRL